MATDPSTLIIAANNAIRHVKEHLDLGASNQPSELFRGGPIRMARSLHAQVVGTRDHILPELRQLQPAAQGMPEDRRNLMMIEVWARNAIKMRAGNCALQAAVAFQYLRTRERVFPLEYMQFATKDHAFVVLGRPADTDISRFWEWSRNAVVCDPWRNSAGYATSLALWYQQTQVSVLTRLDS